MRKNVAVTVEEVVATVMAHVSVFSVAPTENAVRNTAEAV
jgi:hypothetical protein